MPKRPRQAFTIEGLITSPAGFGVTTATPAQRAAMRIIDGRALAELRNHPDVVSLVGGANAINELPSERGVAPAEVVFLASIRSLKTIIALAAGIKAALTVDLAGLIHGEIPRVSILSLDLDKAGSALGILRAVVQASPILRRFLVGDPTRGVVTLRHPSGRPVEIAIIAGKAAGGSLVARWSAGFIADEAPRMAGQSDGVVNFDDARTAVQGRLLPGAPALYIGSPWAPRGPIHALDTTHWQRPSDQIVVLKGTGPLLNPIWWTPERCAKLAKANPTAYQTDVLGKYVDPEATMYSGDLLDAATRKSPEVLPPDQWHYYVAAMDPATRGNAWTLVIATCDAEQGLRHHDRIVLAYEWTPRPGDPLSPKAVFAEMARMLAPYRVDTVRTDQWSADALRDIAAEEGLSLHEMTMNTAERFDIYDSLRIRLEDGTVELAPVRALRDDLNRVKKKATASSMTIELPHTADGRHCDFAPAVALALRYQIPAPDAPPPRPGTLEWGREQERLETERHATEAARRREAVSLDEAISNMALY